MRAINHDGLTGNIVFNSKGDPVSAKYFIIQITSADSAKWGDNKVVKVMDVKPPA